MVSNIGVLVLVTLVTLGVGGGQGYVQEVILYESNSATPSFHTFRRHLSDMTTCYNETARICTRGFWVGFADRDFAGHSTNVHGFDSDEYCIDSAKYAFKSMRYGGNLETTISTLSVYPEEGYQGREQLVTQFDGLINGLSFLFTGQRSWSLYEEQNFHGKISCVSMSDVYIDLEVYGHANVTKSLGLRQIGSAHPDCDEKTRKQFQEHLIH